MGDLSAHFSLSEFRCKCGKCGLPTGVNPALLDGLETLRGMAGDVPLGVNSGGRCPQHNRAVGGSIWSQHIVNPQKPVLDAADVAIRGFGSKQLFLMAEQIPQFFVGGIGYYPGKGFVHVDVRGRKARWMRTADGQYKKIPADFYRA